MVNQFEVVVTVLCIMVIEVTKMHISMTLNKVINHEFHQRLCQD